MTIHVSLPRTTSCISIFYLDLISVINPVFLISDGTGRGLVFPLLLLGVLLWTSLVF